MLTTCIYLAARHHNRLTCFWENFPVKNSAPTNQKCMIWWWYHQCKIILIWMCIRLFIYCKHCHFTIKKKRENFVSNHHSYCKRVKWVTFFVSSANTILGALLNKKLLLFTVINCRFPDIFWQDVVGIWFTCTFLFDYNTWLYSFKLTQ